jgi:Uma2 family endonuclease
MTATLTPPEQVTEQKVILDNISWETYQRLMEERGEHPKPRYAYDRGRLEIMVSSYEHENLKHMIAMLVELLAGELEMDIEAAASTTFQREDLAQGFEPDASFYLQQAARIRGKKRIDLDTDPAPELVIEIDITHPSLNKFPIFAGLGIPEVWRYHKQTMIILKLEGETYGAQEASEIFPGLTSTDLTRLIGESQRMKRAEWMSSVRELVRALKAQR